MKRILYSLFGVFFFANHSLVFGQDTNLIRPKVQEVPDVSTVPSVDARMLLTDDDPSNTSGQPMINSNQWATKFWVHNNHRLFNLNPWPQAAPNVGAIGSVVAEGEVVLENYPGGELVYWIYQSNAWSPTVLNDASGGGAPNFMLEQPLDIFNTAAPQSAPTGATAGAVDGSIAVENYVNATAIYTYSGGWSLATWTRKTRIDFEHAGGLEGTGLSVANQEANWALIKTLETIQDTIGLPIYFPVGTWEVMPDLAQRSSYDDPYGFDHVEWDGDTIIQGAGRELTTISFKRDRVGFQFFRQRTWDDCELIIEDINLVSPPPHNALFTADETTDLITSNGHGFISGVTSLSYTTNGTLPPPLTDNNTPRVVPIVRDANTFLIAGENGTYGTKTPRGITSDGADKVLSAGHGYANDTPVGFYPIPGTTLPTGITEGQRYYVINAGANDFEISLTVSGPQEPITTTGTGVSRCQDIINITGPGTGDHTIYDLTGAVLIDTGYNTGMSGGDNSVGNERLNVAIRRCKFQFGLPFSKTNSNGAVDLDYYDNHLENNVGVGIFLSGRFDGTTEGTDYERPDNKISDSTFLGVRETGDFAFGNHFIYAKTTPNTVISGNTFRGCWTNAVQIQDENSPISAGSQTVVGNQFDNNQSHFYGGHAEDARSALIMSGNSFRRDGIINFRGDFRFTGNYFEVNTTPAFNITSTAGDVIQRNDVLDASNNTFIIKAITAPNAIFSGIRDGIHKFIFKDNTIKKDPDLGGTLWLGNLGSNGYTGDVIDDDSAAINGTQIYIVAGADRYSATFESANASAAVEFFSIDAGDAPGPGNGPYIDVAYNAAPGGTAVYYNEAALDPDNRFLFVSPTGYDMWVRTSDLKTMIKIKHDSGAASHAPIYIDGDAANVWQRMLFVSPTNSNGSYATNQKSIYILDGNTYDINDSNTVAGWYLYEGNFTFKNEYVDNIFSLFETQENGSNSLIQLINCEFKQDRRPPATRWSGYVNHSGWRLTGRDNLFNDGCYFHNQGNQHVNFRKGRNPVPIASASDIYIDPSYDEHIITGVTTINNIEIGVTGNVASVAGIAHEDAFTGSIKVIVEDTLSFSGTGNIPAYTATGAEALTLLWQDNNTWLIVE